MPDLPAPVRRLLDAANANDTDAFLRCFTADGTVELDEPGAEALDLGAGGVQVRNLDHDLEEEIPALDESAIARELAITAPTRPSLEKSAGESSGATEPAARRQGLEQLQEGLLALADDHRVDLGDRAQGVLG